VTSAAGLSSGNIAVWEFVRVIRRKNMVF